MSSRGVFGTVGLMVSLVALFIARRILTEGTVHTALLYLGAIGVLGSIAWRTSLWSRATGAVRNVEGRICLAYAGVALSLLLWVLSTKWGLDILGVEGESVERTETILDALWPAVMSVSVAALLFMELAYRRMPVAEAVETRRVWGAAQSGTSLALALIFLFSINYVANQRDVRKDLSYFKTTQPSGSTLRMVKALGEPVEVMLFYPRVNEVLDQLRPYFDALDKNSPKLKVTVRDHALEPELAREHQVRGNGYVVLLKGKGRGQQAEKFEVGTDLESARSRLRTLDGNFQQSFARLTRVRRTIYLTAGHDERSAGGLPGEKPGEQTRLLLEAFQRANVETRPLGMAQGLAGGVPDDAPAVAVVGPRKPFLPEEARSLLQYVKEGGRLVVMVDPTVEHGLEPLFRGLGLKMLPGSLASEREHLRRTNTPADRGLVFSNRYSSHPTVTMASQHQNDVASVFVQGGALEKSETREKLPGTQVVFPIRTPGQVWRDLDGNWERGPSEPLEQANMMAAVSVPVKANEDGRAVIIADGDFVTDQVIRNPGNGLVFGDIVNWFLGQEQIIGETSSEEDVRIEHTREEDTIWFYATSFGVPLPILGAGVWIAMRRRRLEKRRETHGEGGGRGAGKPAGSPKPSAPAAGSVPPPSAAAKAVASEPPPAMPTEAAQRDADSRSEAKS